MALYLELEKNVVTNADFLARMSFAIGVSASDTLLGVGTTAEARKWAGAVLYNTDGERNKVVRILVSQFKDLEVDAILNSNDATLQTQADNVVAKLIQVMNNQ